MILNRIYEFEHKKFGKMEVLVDKEDKRILFSDNFLKEKLKVKNQMLPMIGDVSITNKNNRKDYDVFTDFREIFEYIRYSKLNENDRWDFEEWVSEIVQDLFKLI